MKDETRRAKRAKETLEERSSGLKNRNDAAKAYMANSPQWNVQVDVKTKIKRKVPKEQTCL